MFASFSDTIAQGTGILFFVGVFWFFMAQRYMKHNPEVKDAAKQATSKVALHGIAAIVKRIVK